MSGVKPLTHFQRCTLERLQAKSEAYPARGYGFWASTIGPRHAAVCRRVLGPAGLVLIERQSSNSFRYSITASGRAAIGRVTL